MVIERKSVRGLGFSQLMVPGMTTTPVFSANIQHQDSRFPSVCDQILFAKVQVMTAAAIMADEETVKAIDTSFDRAEQAIQGKDLDGLMAFYSKRPSQTPLHASLYEDQYGGAAQWRRHGGDHVHRRVVGARETGNKVTIDSWFERCTTW